MRNEIAIVGVAGRFPDASTVDEFWENLCAGHESVRRLDDSELEDRFDEETRRSPNYVKARPILDGVENFDADFFSMHAREAELTDPQHRIFLECAWEALEDAGQDPAACEGQIGVFAGASMNTYFLNNVCQDRRAVETFTSSLQVGCYPELVGAGQDFLATRVSYKLDLRGVSVSLQAACSTSLLAITQACQSLLLYQCDLALAGGVSITFPQKRGYLHQEGGMVSKDGHCRPFDANASGTVFGSGAGVVLLKRLDDALAARDRIYAVIRGWGVNNDGASKAGFTAPSVDGQAAAIEMALAMAGLSANEIGYVECHGTATPLGDPIEIAGLTKAFRATTQERQFCAIGSVKGNIGHLDAAAGVAGLIKTALSLAHRRKPASLHFERPNPQIDFAATPFFVNAATTPWTTGTAPRRAGVSALGVGGTNVHVILEEAPQPEVIPAASGDGHAFLLPLSARSETALDQARDRLTAHLQRHSEQDLADVAFTLQAGRRAFEHRCFVVCQDRQEAVAKLGDRSNPPAAAVKVLAQNPPVAFMFPGQGAQYPDMGRGLYEQEPEFRRQVDRCVEILQPLMGCDLRAVLYPSDGPAAAGERLRSTAIAQPAIFVTEYALAQLWMSWGIRPAAMIGHSIGELTAAVLAGVFSLTDALALVALRGRLIQELPTGAMLAVRQPAVALEVQLEPPLAIAAVNGPSLCVVAGPHDAVTALQERLEAEGVMTRRLHTSHAFHSPMMDPIVEPLRAHLATMSLSAPTLPYISGVTGDWVSREDAVSPDYWARHAREPVQFAAGIGKLEAAKWPILLEAGPGTTLATLALQASRGTKRVVLSSLPDAANAAGRERDGMLSALGSLWTNGVTPDWKALDGGVGSRVALPTYPFQRSRYWIDPPPRHAMEAADRDTGTAGSRVPGNGTEAGIPGIPVLGKAIAASVATREAARPTTGTAQTLAAIFEELSGEPVEAGSSASFLEMGFDSLFLSQVTQRIQRQFGVKVQFRQLLGEYTTITALAAYLEQQRGSSPEGVKSGSPGAPSVLHANGPAAATATLPATDGPSRLDVYRARRQAVAGDLTAAQRRQLEALIRRYVARTIGSKRYTQKFRPVLADPRAAAGFSPDWKEMVYPIVAVRSRGSKLWDIDDNEYIDLVNGYGQTAFGHLPEFVAAAIKQQLKKGFAIGPQAELAGEVASLVAELTGNERIAFCNTGSEAVMAALRVARAVTGRERVVMFNGAYHGQFDEVLVKGVTRQGLLRALPAAAGIPDAAVSNVIMLDTEAPGALRWIEENANDLAAVVVEPVQSRHPDLRPIEFLRDLRRITEAAGAAFIMDEVVTGFRTHPGGMQALTGIRADLVTYGKVVGGGMPIGILAGKSQFMDALDGGMWRYGDDSVPSAGVTFFAGTFVRHPLALAAARAVLLHLKTQGDAVLHTETVSRTAALVSRLNSRFQAHGLRARIESFASWFYFDLSDEHPLARLLFYLLRERGIYIQEGFPCFLTTAHSKHDVQRIIDAFEVSLAELDKLGIVAAGPAEAPATLAATEARLPAPSAELHPTENQTEIWLAAQLGDEASCAFNESMTLRLKGKLDEDAFRKAWDRILLRHDALRACFGPTGEILRIKEKPPALYSCLDLSGEPDREAALAALVEQDARTPFDLAEGPLVRGLLLRLSAQESAFLFTAHHIVCDGWSANLILEELSSLYTAFCHRKSDDLPVPLAFSDYARSKQQETGAAQTAVETFWLKQFEQPISLPELPLDRVRPATRSFKGGTRTCWVEPDLYRTVKEAGARQGCTLFVMLLAAFKILLGRLADQSDIAIGIPTAGQSLLEDRALVGQCVNFLPIRSRHSSNMKLDEYLALVRERVLAAHEHQDYTLGTLVRKLAPPREPGRLPLTELQFNLERLTQSLSLPALGVEVQPNPKAVVNFDLFLNVIEGNGKLRIDCDYNTDLWDAATIDRWLDYYRRLLESMVENSAQPVSSLRYMPDAERDHLAIELNRTARPYPRDSSISAMFQAQVKARPEAIAVRAGSESLTYEALDKRANRLANALRAQVEGERRLIGVAVERSVDMLAILLGVLKAGHAYLPLDPSYPPARLKAILSQAGIAALIMDFPEEQDLAPAGAVVLSLPDILRESEGVAETPPEVASAPGDLAYVIYTSGSTGAPKGVEVTHQAVVNLLCAMAREPGLGPDDVLLAITTIAFDIAALELFLPLCVGAEVVITTREAAADGMALKRLLETADATVMQATPATWQMLIEAGFQGPAGFKMLCGGEALPRALANALLQGGGELWNMYGPTETTIWSSCRRISAGSEPITVGRQPIDNTQFYILDQAGQLAPSGKSGELCIGGDGLARGYVKNKALTAEKFIANPFGQGRLYRTGDQARRLPDGEIQILGRRDRQVKLRGFRFELDEVENLLSQSAQLAAAAVVLGEDKAGKSQLAAYVVARPGASPSTAELRQFLAAHLPDYMVPRAWMPLDALPLTVNGKVDRAALPPPEAPDRGAEERAAPSTAMQRKLVEIWHSVLGIDHIGINDDLLDLGADSIHLFQIAARAHKEGIRLSAKQLMQHRTIEELSLQIEAEAPRRDLASSPDERSSHRRRSGAGATAIEEIGGGGL
jgi:amino acid adenylation domain-containing protein